MTFTFIYKLFQIHFPIDSLSHSLSHLNIISSFIIYSFFNSYCRVTDRSPHLDGNREWAQRAQYNKFVREWVEELGQQIFATVIGGRVLGRGG